jgi:hypothetical protein
MLTSIDATIRLKLAGAFFEICEDNFLSAPNRLFKLTLTIRGHILWSRLRINTFDLPEELQ